MFQVDIRLTSTIWYSYIIQTVNIQSFWKTLYKEVNIPKPNFKACAVPHKSRVKKSTAQWQNTCLTHVRPWFWWHHKRGGGRGSRFKPCCLSYFPISVIKKKKKNFSKKSDWGKKGFSWPTAHRGGKADSGSLLGHILNQEAESNDPCCCSALASPESQPGNGSTHSRQGFPPQLM